MWAMASCYRVVYKGSPGPTISGAIIASTNLAASSLFVPLRLSYYKILTLHLNVPHQCFLRLSRDFNALNRFSDALRAQAWIRDRGTCVQTPPSANFFGLVILHQCFLRLSRDRRQYFIPNWCLSKLHDERVLWWQKPTSWLLTSCQQTEGNGHIVSIKLVCT